MNKKGWRGGSAHKHLPTSLRATAEILRAHINEVANYKHSTGEAGTELLGPTGYLD